MLSSKESPLQVLKTLYDKPNMATEITYKLKTDANNGFLLNSQELIRFLKTFRGSGSILINSKTKERAPPNKQEINSPFYN